MKNHCAVWLDQQEARIFRIEAGNFDESTLLAPHEIARHPNPDNAQRHDQEEQRRYFKDLAHALADSAEVLILGPSTAKLHFLKYVHQHDHLLEARIVGVETIDHPTDKQIVAYSRTYFAKGPQSQPTA